MDWLRQLPIGQYVDGSGGWLRRLDPRLKLAWVMAFLLTPVLAGPVWRLGLVALLLLLTLVSGLPLRLWLRSLTGLVLLSVLVGLLSAVLPTGPDRPLPPQRPPQELTVPPLPPAPAWEVARLGPLRVTRRSLRLGVSSATLLLTVVHSANLLLLSTPPEELAWALASLLRPLRRLGVPVDRLGFQLLLALRFLPLVQEELQNLLRGLATRAVNLRQLGWQGGLGLVLALGERLLANVLLRADQAAAALLARGSLWRSPDRLRLVSGAAVWLDGLASVLLVLLLLLRFRIGAG